MQQMYNPDPVHGLLQYLVDTMLIMAVNFTEVSYNIDPC